MNKIPTKYDLSGGNLTLFDATTGMELSNLDNVHLDSCEVEKGIQICFPEGCSDPFEDEETLTGVYRSNWMIDTEIPIFKGECRDYVDRLVFIGED